MVELLIILEPYSQFIDLLKLLITKIVKSP